MKYSIKRQMIAVYLGLILLVIGLICFINSTYLEPFYMQSRQDNMVTMYEILERAVDEKNIASEDTQDEIEKLCRRNNLQMIVVSSDGTDIVFSTDMEKRGMLYLQLYGYLVGMINGEVLEEGDSYAISKVNDQFRSGGYIEMYGKLSDESIFLIQSSLDSIRDSVNLTNRFLIYIGIVVLLVGAVFVWFFSERITKPLQELTQLSERMANLDFNAKYTSGGTNEIGVLGGNFNKMSEQLEETISELKSANNQLQKDIEQKKKMEDKRSEFIGNISHELKTPIALIQGYAEGLKEGIADDPESAEFYCDVIIDESVKMNQMVKNLLTLNQLEFGNDEVEFARFDVVRLIRGVITSCDILIQQAEAKVDFIADEETFVWADEYKVEQVFRNYLTNAIHHVDNEKRIEVRVIPQKDTVRITVFNSGKPIPEEDVDKIWDKFYKVDKAHTREYGGNGIGLSIVKAIMESFHQKYGVNNFDNGVEFWFELDANVSTGREKIADAGDRQLSVLAEQSLFTGGKNI